MTHEPQCVFLRAADSFAPCVDYVARTFSRWARFRCEICTPEEFVGKPRPEHPSFVMYYATRDNFQAWFSSIEKKGKGQHLIGISRSAFFGQSFLESPDLPESPSQLLDMAKEESFSKHVEHIGERVCFVDVDLIASSFWFLTRYEEYVISPPEAHDRFLCSFSIAPTEMYDQPVVNRWFEQLKALVLRLAKKEDTMLVPRKATVVLTHDIDLLRKYRGLAGVRRTISAMMHGDAREATSEIRMASLVLAGLRRDPFDSFDEMFSLKERIGAPSTFFLMGGGDAPLDGDYSLEDQNVRELIMRILSKGDEIGVHPSYETYRSPELIQKETKAVEEAIGHPVIGARQHYLRFALPETWYALAECGLRYDSTLGFADKSGFRCGWSGCLRPFDIEKRIELPIIELPLVAMDITLAVYEKIPPEKAIERLARLMDASETPGGAFVVLWHNTLHDRRAYPGYWDTMEYFLFASAGTVEFTTAGKMCEEFELRMVHTG